MDDADPKPGPASGNSIPIEPLRVLRQAAVDVLHREGATPADIAVSEKVIADIDREIARRQSVASLN